MSTTHGTLRLVVARREVELDRKLGGGGEGEVFSVVGAPEIVAKIFLGKRRPALHLKLTEMLKNRPRKTGFQGHTILTWPDDLLEDAAGAFIGYVMPHVTDAEKIYKLKNPASRKGDARTKQFQYDRLIAVAVNLVSAVELAHREGLVVGDLNAQNVLVSSDTRASLIDVDSFQLIDAGGRCHPCSVGTPEYLAPELIGKNLAAEKRDPASDLFSLAVLLYELLMEGQHPYAGKDRGATHPPDSVGRISAGLFPGARTRQVDADLPRASPPREMLAPDILALFHRCFDEGHHAPAMRPAAREWRAALKRWSLALVPCAKNPDHIHGNHLQACPWCARTGITGATPTPPATAPVSTPKATPKVTTPPRPSPSGPGATPSPPATAPPPSSATPSSSPVSAQPVAKTQRSPSASRPSGGSATSRVLGLMSVLLAIGGGYKYMTSQPRGIHEICALGTDCASQICVIGHCETERRKKGDDCVVSTDCASTPCRGGVCRECATSSDCELNRICKDAACTSAGLGDRCERDTQCDGKLVCMNGTCAKPRGVTGDACTSDPDCASVCVMKRCRATRLPDGSLCKTSMDCVKSCIGGICGATPPPSPPTPSPTAEPAPQPSTPPPARACPAPSRWDDEVRGWAKVGSPQCTKSYAKPVVTGYYLRVAASKDKETSMVAIKDAWRRYVDTYLRDSPCPRAKEVVFFDPVRTHGAGILLPEMPPHWDDVVRGEPDWILQDAGQMPVTDEVCFFPASEDRRRSGW